MGLVKNKIGRKCSEPSTTELCSEVSTYVSRLYFFFCLRLWNMHPSHDCDYLQALKNTRLIFRMRGITHTVEWSARLCSIILLEYSGQSSIVRGVRNKSAFPETKATIFLLVANSRSRGGYRNMLQDMVDERLFFFRLFSTLETKNQC